MGSEIVVNKNKNCVFNGLYVGRDLYIIMLEDTEREFIVTHNVNIKPVSYFAGRQTELDELRQRIEEGRKSVLVSGMGGIGKTHICRKLFDEYISQHEKENKEIFRHIGYVEYNGDMGSSLQNCLKYKKQENPESDREAAWRELEYLASDGKLLLFVDNVNVSIGDDPELKRLMSIPGAVVLTSRRTSFSSAFEPYRIGFLSTEQCREIYEKIRFENSGLKIKEEQIQDIEYIIEKLAARHTITIEFLAHLARTKHWTVQKLRDELEKNGFQLEYMDEEDKLVNIQKSYEALYDMSMLTEAEQNILEAFSLFPYIPLSAEMCNQWLLSDAGVEEDEDILVGLYRKGWLQFEIEQESYAMHPVFAQFIFEKYKPKLEEHCGLIEGCQKCLEIPENGVIYTCREFIAYAKNLIEKIGVTDEFCDKLAYLLVYIGEYSTAKEIYKEVLEFRLENLGPDHLNTAISYTNLATAYDSQGEFREAISLYNKALKIQEKATEGDPWELARSYNNLAYAYCREGEYKKAKALYEKVLKIMGENHPDIATSYNNLASVYCREGEYKKAESLCKKALRIQETILGESHIKIVSSYNNLAYIYALQGKYSEAESLYKKGIGIRESVLGKEHLDTANVYNNLAELYLLQHKYVNAKELYEEYIRILKKVLGEDNYYMVIGYSNLGTVYVMQKEYKKALIYLLKAYKIAISELGLKHFLTNITYVGMQIAYYEYVPNGNFEHWLEEKMKE